MLSGVVPNYCTLDLIFFTEGLTDAPSFQASVAAVSPAGSFPQSGDGVWHGRARDNDFVARPLVSALVTALGSTLELGRRPSMTMRQRLGSAAVVSVSGGVSVVCSGCG